MKARVLKPTGEWTPGAYCSPVYQVECPVCHVSLRYIAGLMVDRCEHFIEVDIDSKVAIFSEPRELAIEAAARIAKEKGLRV